MTRSELTHNDVPPTTLYSAKMAARRVVIGADHGGFELKQILASYLRSTGVEVLDVGTHDTASVRRSLGLRTY